jgi:hypothetical protein
MDNKLTWYLIAWNVTTVLIGQVTQVPSTAFEANNSFAVGDQVLIYRFEQAHRCVNMNKPNYTVDGVYN